MTTKRFDFWLSFAVFVYVANLTGWAIAAIHYIVTHP